MSRTHRMHCYTWAVPPDFLIISGTLFVDVNARIQTHEALRAVTPRHCLSLSYIITPVIATLAPIWYYKTAEGA